MNILISDLTNKYEKCRRLGSCSSKVFVLKNKQSGSVGTLISEFERLASVHDQSDYFELFDIADLISLLPAKGNRVVYTLAQLNDALKGEKK